MSSQNDRCFVSAFATSVEKLSPIGIIYKLHQFQAHAPSKKLREVLRDIAQKIYIYNSLIEEGDLGSWELDEIRDILQGFGGIEEVPSKLLDSERFRPDYAKRLITWIGHIVNRFDSDDILLFHFTPEALVVSNVKPFMSAPPRQKRSGNRGPRSKKRACLFGRHSPVFL